MKQIYIYLILILMLSCKDLGVIIRPECTTSDDYLFLIPVEISPNKYIFETGDTITIRFDFSDQLEDETENKTYTFEDYKEFYPAVRFIHLDSTGEDRFFFNYADTCCMDLENMFVQHYANKHDDAGIGFNFDYRDNRYYASLSFILQEKGIYYLRIVSESDKEFPGNFEGICKLRHVNIGIRHNCDTNFDLVKWYLYPDSTPELLEHNRADQQFVNIGGYAFEVK